MFPHEQKRVYSKTTELFQLGGCLHGVCRTDINQCTTVTWPFWILICKSQGDQSPAPRRKFFGMLTVIHHSYIFLNLAEPVAALPLMGSTFAAVASRGRVAEFCDGHGIFPFERLRKWNLHKRGALDPATRLHIHPQ